MAIAQKYPRVFLVLLLALALLAPTLVLTPAARADDCTVTSPNDSGAGTLRTLLAGACATITFQAGLSQVNLTSRLEIARDVTVQGLGAATTALAYTGAPSALGSVIWVHGGTVMLRDLTLTGGKTDGTWGAGLTIYDGVSGATTVTLDGVTVTQNSAKNAGGGGIYASNATLHLVNSLVSDNTADNSAANDGYGGGGMFLDDGNGAIVATLTNSTVRDNHAPLNRGGGIRLWDKDLNQTATLTLTNSTVSGNSSGVPGGLDNEAGKVTLTNSTLSGNTGGYRQYYGIATASGTTFAGNTGAGITISDGPEMVLTNSTISDNTDVGVSTTHNSVNLVNSTVSGNGRGGLQTAAGDFTLTNSTVSGNTGGPGISIFDHSGLTLYHATVVGNVSPVSGGGVRNEGMFSTATNRASIIVGNRGGAVDSDCAQGTDAHLTSEGDNLVGQTTGCPSNGTGDIALSGAPATVLDLSLADNGGPTKTNNLVPGSPAIDRIPISPTNRCTLGNDQRGVTRPKDDPDAPGDGCDIGAVEYTPAPPSPSPSPSPSSNPSPSPSPSTGPCGTRFGDVPASDPACVAIEALAARGVINGCDSSATPPLFCPNDPTLRHQMAALIVRAIPDWAGETGLPSFTDNTEDTELMTRVGTLQRHNVVRGYQDEVCVAQGKTPPCYGPLDTVRYGQALLFIARAMVERGYWALQPDDRTIFPDQNGAVGADPNTDQQTKDHRMVVTYVHYVGNPPGVADVHAPFQRSGVAQGGWGDDSTRAWFARAFWPAIQNH